MLWEPEIIIVAVENAFTARFMHRAIDIHAPISWRLVEDHEPDAGIRASQRIGYGDDIRRRTVTNDKDFDVRDGLPLHARNRAWEGRGTVVSGNDHACIGRCTDNHQGI